MPSFLGGTTYHWDQTIAARVRLLRPGVLVVGEGAWFALREIADVVGPECLLILRDVIGGVLSADPLTVASRLALVAGSIPNGLQRCIAHGLNEEYSRAFDAANWEYTFVSHAHNLGLRTICLNLAYGNDPPDVLRPVAAASDFVGAHLYDGWQEDVSPHKWAADIYTSRRYAAVNIPDVHWPEWWPTDKHIALEVGVERRPERGRVGWSAEDGPSEFDVIQHMLVNLDLWQQDGLLGACWFTLGHSDTSWESYGTTDDMLRAWALGPQVQVTQSNLPDALPTPTIGPILPATGTSLRLGGAVPIDKALAQEAIDIAWGNQEALKAGRVSKKRRLELANDTEAHLVTIKDQLSKA